MPWRQACSRRSAAGLVGAQRGNASTYGVRLNHDHRAARLCSLQGHVTLFPLSTRISRGSQNQGCCPFVQRDPGHPRPAFHLRLREAWDESQEVSVRSPPLVSHEMCILFLAFGHF